MDSSGPVMLRRHFDQISGAYYDIVDRLWYDVGYYHKREMEFVRERLPTHLNLSIDAGCGPGRHTPHLVSVSKRVVAVDISSEMLRLTRSRMSSASERVDLVQADVRKLPFKPGVADFILNLEVLEHLPVNDSDLSLALNEFRRVLGRDGLLVTEAPLRRHSWWGILGVKPSSWKEIDGNIRKEFYEKHPLTVEKTYREATVESRLREAGFELFVKTYVRVLPAGMIERHACLEGVDRLLERLPIVNRLAREALWLVKCAAR